MELKIKLVRTSQEQKNVLDIRRSVFIDEQQIPVEIEIDAFEESAIYVIAYFDEEAVGTARWREIGNTVKLERFAVLKNYRNKGIGRKLTMFIIDRIPQGKIIFLNSQESSIGFYSKLGFISKGPLFKEANILHQKLIFPRKSSMKP